MTVSLSKILKCSVEANQIQHYLKDLPPEAKPLADDKMHITLMHQSFANDLPHDAKFPEHPAILLGEKIFMIKRDKRTSWIVLLAIQGEWRRYVKKVCYENGLSPDPEPYRVYHVSIANLTGSPFDSVGDVDVSDLA
jgi:hypothetical protein